MDIITEVKERPILFQTEMIRAILEGRKTVTRRTIKPQPTKCEGASIDNPAFMPGDYIWHNQKHSWHTIISNKKNGPTDYGQYCPYGKPGDVLWVRETWNEIFQRRGTTQLYTKSDLRFHRDKYFDRLGYIYAAGPNDEEPITWKPSIHMPKAACRIRLEIKSIRVERLHDITEEDAIREGVLTVTEGNTKLFWDYISEDDWFTTARESFRTLWKKINGVESWNANPWVWVISFEKL